MEGVVLLLVLVMVSDTICQTCTLTDDCADSGTTCQDVRIPTKTGTTYGTRTEKRCICTESSRQPCFDTADCARLFPGVPSLNCFASSVCFGQSSIGYCRQRTSSTSLAGFNSVSSGSVIVGTPLLSGLVFG